MKRHISYFDLLRVAASLFVVFMHTAAGALRTEVAARPGWYVLAGLSSLAFCAVPLFFMITGYLLTASDATGDARVLLRRRLPRLVVPLAFWSLLYILWEMAQAGELGLRPLVSMSISALQKPVNVSLWFMYALVAMYLVSPLVCGGLRSLDRRGERLILGLILLVKGLTLVRVLFHGFYTKYLAFEALEYLETFGGNLACFVLGWFLGKTERSLPRPLLWMGALAAWGAITAGTILRSREAGAYVSDFQTQTYGFELLLAACVFLLAKGSAAAEAPALRRITRALGPCTFPIYLMHNLLLKMTASFWPAASLTGVLVKTLGIYAASLAVAAVCAAVPGLSYLACGLRFRGRSMNAQRGKREA